MRINQFLALNKYTYDGLPGVGAVASQTIVFALDNAANRSSGKITVRAGVTTFQHSGKDRDVNIDTLNDNDSDRFNERTYYGAG